MLYIALPAGHTLLVNCTRAAMGGEDTRLLLAETKATDVRVAQQLRVLETASGSTCRPLLNKDRGSQKAARAS